MRKENLLLLNDVESQKLPMNLQMFASDNTSSGDKDDNDDNDNNNSNDDNKPAKDGNTDSKDKDADKDNEKKFSQKEVNRMMSREKKQGRNSVYAELGLDEKTAKSDLAEFKKWKESQMSEDEKAAADKAESDKKIREAEERALLAEAKATAMKMGIKKDCVDDVVILAMAKVSEDTDLDTAISEIKTKFPSFVQSEDDEKPGKKGTGSSVNNRTKGSKSDKSLGKRLAANRNVSKQKSSFF